ncbi:hypothetical protein E2C01_021536 [Portunus trituberculatus]|uniref:Uncharacterized protein n=1 Tax=Portunus trituberculatus TaxID=210409 RepID=A0A5B7E4M3_PORTR|nr:hypothetical protein [Portunus trituberculatus]
MSGIRFLHGGGRGERRALLGRSTPVNRDPAATDSGGRRGVEWWSEARRQAASDPSRPEQCG